MNIITILIMAILIEAIITYVKTWVVDKKFQWQMFAAVFLGILVCIAYGLDIPAAVGITSAIPYIGHIITGILISRGSNYIFDIIKKISSVREEKSSPQI